MRKLKKIAKYLALMLSCFCVMSSIPAQAMEYDVEPITFGPIEILGEQEYTAPDTYYEEESSYYEEEQQDMYVEPSFDYVIDSVEDYEVLPQLHGLEEVKERRYLSDFSDDEIVQKKIGYGNLYLRDRNERGNLISVKIEGITIAFKKGVLAHARADVIYDLGENHNYSYFSGYLGVDSSQPNGNVKFTISGSNDLTEWTTLKQTDALRGNGNSEYAQVDIKGKRYLRFYIDENGGNGNDHSVIANAMVYEDGFDTVGQTIIHQKSYYEKLIREKYEEYLSGMAGDTLPIDLTLLLLQYQLVDNAKFISLNQFMTEADHAEKNKEFMNWFFNDANALSLFAAGGTPVGGNYIRALEVLSELYANCGDALNDKTELTTAYGTRGQLYEKMFYAIALTHSSNVVNWMDAKVASEPVRRFNIYKEMYEAGLLNTVIFEQLEVEELRWVVNNMMYDYEIPWANDYARKHPRSSSANDTSFPMLYSPHHHIRYTSGYNYAKDIYRNPNNIDPKTGLTWKEKYNTEAYGLPYEAGTNLMWHLFEEGSVCGGISKTGANLAQSFGVPAAVIGQPGHAAFLIYSLDEEGNGRWGIDNDVSGWSGSEKGERMLLDWGNASDTWNSQYQVSYVTMAEAALNQYGRYVMAENLVTLASATNDADQKERALTLALEYLPFHMDAWYNLIALKLQTESSNEELLELVQKLGEDMNHYPEPMYDLMGILIGELNTRSFYDEKATVAMAQANLARTAALRVGAAYNNNDFVNANVTRTMANYFLGNRKFSLATFSFDGDHAGQLVFDESYDAVRFQYNISGTESGAWSDYKSAKADEDAMVYDFTPAELAAMDAEHDIIILLEGMQDKPENYFSIDIRSSDVPNNLYPNDKENKLIGVNVNYLEYSINEDGNWQPLEKDTTFKGACDVAVRAKARETYLQSESAYYSFTEDAQSDTRSYISIDRESIAGYSSAQGGDKDARLAIDGTPNTHWHTNWTKDSDLERYIVIEFSKDVYLSGMDYTPRNDTGTNGNFLACSIYVSDDNATWTKVWEGTDWKNDKSVKSATFDTVKAKYVKVKADSGVNNFGAAASLEFFEDLTAYPVIPPEEDPETEENPGNESGTGSGSAAENDSGSSSGEGTSSGSGTATGGSNNSGSGTTASPITVTGTSDSNSATGVITVSPTTTATANAAGTTNKTGATNSTSTGAQTGTTTTNKTTDANGTASNTTKTTASTKKNTNSTAKANGKEEAKTLEETVAEAKSGKTLTAAYPENHILPAKVLKAMQEKKVNLIVTDESKTEWKIEAEHISDASQDMDLEVEVSILEEMKETDTKSLIESLVEEQKTIVALFSHNGKLGTKATVKVPLSKKELDYIGTTAVSVYHVNEEQKSLEAVKEEVTITEDGYVEFDITTCSPYIFVKEEKEEVVTMAEASAQAEVQEAAAQQPQATTGGLLDEMNQKSPLEEFLVPILMGVGGLVVIAGLIVLLIIVRKKRKAKE